MRNGSLTTDAFIREQGSDEPFPYAEGGAPRDDPKAGEAILSWGLAYRDRCVHVDCSILLPYHRNDEGGIDWDAQVTEAGSVAGEVPTEIAQGLMAPRGDDLAGVVMDARKAGHVIVLVDGKPFRGPR